MERFLSKLASKLHVLADDIGMMKTQTEEKSFEDLSFKSVMRKDRMFSSPEEGEETKKAGDEMKYISDRLDGIFKEAE